MTFRELVEEKKILKVSTYKGTTSYTEDDIREMLNNISYGADDLPKWLFVALLNTKYSKKKRYKIVENILNAILAGKIKYIDFNRSTNGDIIGIKNISLTDYI